MKSVAISPHSRHIKNRQPETLTKLFGRDLLIYERYPNHIVNMPMTKFTIQSP